MSPADLTTDASRCWLTLGHPKRAEQSLTDGIGMLAPSRQRTRSLALAYRAESALARRDLDAAANDARSALDTALGTEASRCIKLVNDAAKQITSHPSHPAVRDLQAHIQALSPRPSPDRDRPLERAVDAPVDGAALPRCPRSAGMRALPGCLRTPPVQIVCARVTRCPTHS
ncbi:hypothetical protein AB0N88_36395 [Streptomyces sp. NPDC093516]|uniref:hypothetical protein n=1 Tax=Streptomyces sp. NPDC093516 TaxID=3155304 RepID=UPI003447AC61